MKLFFQPSLKKRHAYCIQEIDAFNGAKLNRQRYWGIEYFLFSFGILKIFLKLNSRICFKNFVKSIPSVEKQILNLATASSDKQEAKENKSSASRDEYPPIRQTITINPNSAQPVSNHAPPKKEENKSAPKLSNKSPKPKDYGEWSKLELFLFLKFNLGKALF